MDQVGREVESWGEPRLTMSPSSTSGDCPREIQLGMLGHRTATEAKNRRRMDNGTDAHARWTRTLARAGLLLTASRRLIELDDGVRLLDTVRGAKILDGRVPFWSGELDVVVRHPTALRRFVGELKTMNSFRWKKVPPQDPDHGRMARILAATEHGYLRQLTQYIVKFAPVFHTEDTGIFVFENTDTQEYKVRFVRPSDEQRAEAFANGLAARAACRQGVLIDPPFRRKSATCRGCYREATCYALADGDLDLVGTVEARLQEVAGR